MNTHFDVFCTIRKWNMLLTDCLFNQPLNLIAEKEKERSNSNVSSISTYSEGVPSDTKNFINMSFFWMF